MTERDYKEDVEQAVAQTMSITQLTQILTIASKHTTLDMLSNAEYDQQLTLGLVDLAKRGDEAEMIAYRDRFDLPTTDVHVRSLLIKELVK